MLMIIFLVIALVLGIMVFRMGWNADWHWAGSSVATLLPLGFTFVLGLIGLIIGIAFVGAVWKATDV